MSPLRPLKFWVNLPFGTDVFCRSNRFFSILKWWCFFFYSFVFARVLDSVLECDIFRVKIMFRISFVKREVKMLFFFLYTQFVSCLFFLCLWSPYSSSEYCIFIWQASMFGNVLWKRGYSPWPTSPMYHMYVFCLANVTMSRYNEIVVRIT